MKTIIISFLSCLSVLAAGASDIRMSTWTYKILPEDSLATVDVYTRDGQTNLVRNTQTKDGVVLFRSQSFYHDSIQVGTYMYDLANPPDRTIVGSVPGAPYYFSVAFDASNRPLIAHITATNLIELDLFFCTNGVFYPAEGSLIQQDNNVLTKTLHPH
jgi:hypothetical protein